MSPSPPRSPTIRPRIAVSVPSRARAELEVDQLAGRRVGGGEVLAAAEHEPHGAAERQRGGRGERLGDHQLAAERAADRRGLDADRGPAGRPSTLAEALADHERALRARVHDERRRRARSRRASTAARGRPGGPSSCGSGPRRRTSALAQRRRRRRRCACAGGPRRWAVAVARGLVAARGRRRARAGVVVAAGRWPSAAPRRVGRQRRLEVEHAGSGSASTITSAAPSSAAASVSAITSATGWPDHTISSRASGSRRAARPALERQVLRAVSTATTPGTAERRAACRCP